MGRARSKLLSGASQPERRACPMAIRHRARSHLRRSAPREYAATSGIGFSWIRRRRPCSRRAACAHMRDDRGSHGALPRDRPRYLMGVGKPEQIADYVALGIDMMDCVLPTRAARHACLYTSEGRVLIKNARYAADQRPPDLNCSCSVCRRYTRAYLRHLFAAGELTAAILATHHNVHFYLDLMRQIREAIEFGNLANFSSEMHARYAVGPA